MRDKSEATDEVNVNLSPFDGDEYSWHSLSKSIALNATINGAASTLTFYVSLRTAGLISPHILLSRTVVYTLRQDMCNLC